MIRADHLSDMQVHINILLELQLTLSASINPYNGIMGVRGTSVPIQIWNSFPFGDNSLPLQVFPLPRSDRQTEAIEKLMAYLEDIPGGQDLLQQYLDITTPPQPIDNFWEATTHWQDMTQSLIPQGSITHQSVIM